MVTDKYVNLLFLKALNRAHICLAAAVKIEGSWHHRVHSRTAERAHTIGLSVFFGVIEERNRSLGVSGSMYEAYRRIAECQCVAVVDKNVGREIFQRLFLVISSYQCFSARKVNECFRCLNVVPVPVSIHYVFYVLRRKAELIY